MGIVFPGGKTKCVTFSYDDGPNQDVGVIKILDEYGMKGTFNLINRYVGAGRVAFNHLGQDVDFTYVTETEIPIWYAGHEIASHGKMHYAYDSLNLEQLKEEVMDNISYLERVGGKRVVGGAYPGGQYTSQTVEELRKMGLEYYRTIEDTHGFGLPDDFLMWHPTCHDNDEQITDLAEKFINAGGDDVKVFYIWGHAYELDKKDNDRWGNFRRTCERFGKCGDIWYATNAELCEYVKKASNRSENIR